MILLAACAALLQRLRATSPCASAAALALLRQQWPVWQWPNGYSASIFSNEIQ